MPFLANCMLPIIACNDILSPMDGVEKAPSTGTTRCTMKRPTAAVPASTSVGVPVPITRIAKLVSAKKQQVKVCI